MELTHASALCCMALYLPCFLLLFVHPHFHCARVFHNRYSIYRVLSRSRPLPNLGQSFELINDQIVIVLGVARWHSIHLSQEVITESSMKKMECLFIPI